MSASVLLAEVRSLGIIISADGDDLTIRPASKLTPELRASIRAAKPELLEMLLAEQPPKNLDAADAASSHAGREVPLADQLPDFAAADPADDQFVDAGNWDADDQLGTTAAASLRAPKIQSRSRNTKALAAVSRPDPEETGRRKALASDILAGIAAAADGDFIDPSNFDDIAPQGVAERTAHLLDAQTAANNARQEAARPRQATTPAAMAAVPSPRGQASQEIPLLDAIHRAWPEAVALPVEVEPPPPNTEFDGLVQRLATALMTPRPWQRITDPVRARGYFEARARHLLSRAKDPIAEIEREEQVARQFATASPPKGQPDGA
jgi:hypothetical protein